MDLPLLITNNSLCVKAFAGRCLCHYNESWTYGQVLEQARDCLHQGYVLLGHPQSGGLKPNQTPYRSLLLAQKGLYGPEDFSGLALIEQAIAAHRKFQNDRPTPDWAEHIRQDFRTIDLSLMESVFSRI